MSPAAANGPRRRGQASVAANPVLVGAVTTLVVLVAVFLAYNANNGLPFVPTRQLKVDLANGNELVKGNEVREGGFRVGVVDGLAPVKLPDGTVGAQATLKLDKKAGALPADSQAVIRAKSALGLEYVEIDRGTSSRTIADGGTLPADQTRQQVELDQVLATFDQPTRTASQTNLQEFGDAFAGRGADLNTTIQRLPRTLGLLTSVAGNLADPQTGLRDFLQQLDITAATLAPVSPVLAHLFTTLANTFSAIDRSPRALQDTIAKAPATLDVSTRSLAVQTPFLLDTAALGHDLQGAVHELRVALPDINSAISIGTRVTRRTPGLYQNLQDAVRALRDLASTPTTNAALRGLTATVGSLQPQLRFIGPYVTVCNYWTYFWSWAAESQTAPTPSGYALRAQLNLGSPGQTNDVGVGAANTPANGGGPGVGPSSFLHAQAYQTAVTDSGKADCSVGQTGYLRRSATGVPANYNTAVDPIPPLPYRVGPTYGYVQGGHGLRLGPDQVPAGETFTRQPGGLGAQIAQPRAHPDNLPPLSFLP